MEERITGCLVCGTPLEYFSSRIEMEYIYYHKTLMSNARHVNSHFTCDSRHGQVDLRVIEDMCRHIDSKDPVAVTKKIILSPCIYTYGSKHHVLVGSMLLVVYKNAGGELDLDMALEEMRNRGAQVSGGVYGLWGTCRVAVSIGIFISLITGAPSLGEKERGLCNEVTPRNLGAIAKTGGPRRCKRDFYIATPEAMDLVGERSGIWMKRSKKTVCGLYGRNEQCLKERCPYNLQE